MPTNTTNLITNAIEWVTSGPAPTTLAAILAASLGMLAGTHRRRRTEKCRDTPSPVIKLLTAFGWTLLLATNGVKRADRQRFAQEAARAGQGLPPAARHHTNRP